MITSDKHNSQIRRKERIIKFNRTMCAVISQNIQLQISSCKGLTQVSTQENL